MIKRYGGSERAEASMDDALAALVAGQVEKRGLLKKIRNQILNATPASFG